ncbi:MAG: lmo0937 family membrane protein [Gemmatimonadaceae bacterium]
MLFTLAIVLIVLWALGFLAFHVTSGLIHLLLVVALIVIVIRLITGRRAV